MNATARDLMTPGATCAQEGDTLVEVAQRMRDLGVGALPICDAERHLTGMVTDRDLALRCIAEGVDPATTLAATLAQGPPITIRSDDSIATAIRVMSEHRIRRVPVMDSHGLAGMLSQADIARAASDTETAALVAMISMAPPNN